MNLANPYEYQTGVRAMGLKKLQVGEEKQERPLKYTKKGEIDKRCLKRGIIPAGLLKAHANMKNRQELKNREKLAGIIPAKKKKTDPKVTESKLNVKYPNYEVEDVVEDDDDSDEYEDEIVIRPTTKKAKSQPEPPRSEPIPIPVPQPEEKKVRRRAPAKKPKKPKWSDLTSESEFQTENDEASDASVVKRKSRAKPKTSDDEVNAMIKDFINSQNVSKVDGGEAEEKKEEKKEEVEKKVVKKKPQPKKEPVLEQLSRYNKRILTDLDF